jgi:hypothetical protein
MIAALNRLAATYYKHAASLFLAGFAYHLFCAVRLEQARLLVRVFQRNSK